MEIAYQNTFEDLKFLAEYIVKNTPQGRRLASLMFWRSLLPVAIVSIIPALYGLWIYSLVLFAVAAVIIWTAREKAVIKAVEKQYRKPTFDYFWQPVTLTVTDEGLRTKRESGEGFYKWPMVEQAANKDRYIFVILRGIGNFAVPARAFGSREAKDAFYAAIRAGLSGSGPRS